VTKGGRAVAPKRPVHWGVISVVTSFMLLAAGMALSMKKTEEEIRMTKPQ
jgi:hypothetical protein